MLSFCDDIRLTTDRQTFASVEMRLSSACVSVTKILKERQTSASVAMRLSYGCVSVTTILKERQTFASVAMRLSSGCVSVTKTLTATTTGTPNFIAFSIFKQKLVLFNVQKQGLPTVLCTDEPHCVLILETKMFCIFFCLIFYS